MSVARIATASDHLDTPTVIADPAADIGDLYAWMSPDRKRLNLVLDIFGRGFSDQLHYVFHVDSGQRLGATRATTTIACRFDTADVATCEVDGAEVVRGDARPAAGISDRKRRVRVFAGLRDDPFYNNVRGTRAAYNVAAEALKAGAPVDAAWCPTFDAATTRRIREAWRHTDGGPARNFLAGFTTSALVVSIDLAAVDHGGPLLGVWAGTYKRPATPETTDSRGAMSRTTTRARRRAMAYGEPIDRMGRPLTGNALVGPLDPEAVSNARKEAYNRAAQRDWPGFVADIRRTLGLYDGFDGVCGNQWLAGADATSGTRYQALAELLSDDRLWIDSRYGMCTEFLAVERSAHGAAIADCGGRTPGIDAIDVYRSMLAVGAITGIDDGVVRDEKPPSDAEFPFLVAP